MRKKLLLIILVGLITLGCFLIFFQIKGSEQTLTTSTKYLIGMSQCNLIDPLKIEMNREIERAAFLNSELKIIFTDAAGDSQKQIDDVKMLVDCGIDLLIISPNDSVELEPIISEIYSQIPVIILDPKIVGDNFTMFIGPDNKKIGTLAAQMLSAKLGKNGGNVIEILGSENSSTTQSRKDGFHEELEKQGNIEIISHLCGNWMRDEAEDRLKEYIIVEQPSFDAVFAQSDAMAQGAYIGNNKLRYNNDALFFGVGGFESATTSVESDTSLAGTIFCPTGGKQAVTYAIAILNGEVVPKEIILEPAVID